MTGIPKVDVSPTWGGPLFLNPKNGAVEGLLHSFGVASSEFCGVEKPWGGSQDALLLGLEVRCLMDRVVVAAAVSWRAWFAVIITRWRCLAADKGTVSPERAGLGLAGGKSLAGRVGGTDREEATLG